MVLCIMNGLMNCFKTGLFIENLKKKQYFKLTGILLSGFEPNS